MNIDINDLTTEDLMLLMAESQIIMKMIGPFLLDRKALSAVFAMIIMKENLNLYHPGIVESGEQLFAACVESGLFTRHENAFPS